MNKPIDPYIIKQIQKLRSHGWSINKIYNKFDIGYGTVYRYIKDIEILPKYQKTWKKSFMGSTNRMNRDILIAQSKAKKLVGKLSNRDKMLFLTALYWGEGTKKDLSLINSDPDIIKIFLNTIRLCFNIPNEKIRTNIRIYEDMDKEKCIKFWLNTTSLNKENISSINILNGKKSGKLKYGTCRIRVLKGGTMLKYFKAIKDEVIQKF